MQEYLLFESKDRKPNKIERVAELEFQSRMHDHKMDLIRQVRYNEFFPKKWLSIEDKYPDRPKKIRITARFDEDVVKFFRHTGIGYQAKMNEVLKLYMFARIAKYVEGPQDRDEYGVLI